MILVMGTFAPKGRETGGLSGGCQWLTQALCIECLLGGKSDVGHFPSREKQNNTRKRQALWECSKWEFQLSPEHKQRGAISLEVRPGRALGPRVGGQKDATLK